MPDKIKVSVIGAGRFGSFFGEELSRFFDVVYYDKKKKDCVNKIYAEIEECLKRDIIFLAVPISEIENFLIERGTMINRKGVLVDLSSVKLKPKEYFEKYLPAENEYFLTHPLFGPDSAKFSFEGHKIALTESRISKENDLFIRGVFEDLLKLSIIDLSADEHDRLMAFNLSLMHHLGRTFNEMGIQELKLKMRSLNDIARIAEFVMNDSGQLFKDFYRFNPYSLRVKENFEESFCKISSLL
jgi:prephenate dehydrogenase